MAVEGNESPGVAWQAETLRLTAFPFERLSDKPGWWKEIIGEEPESRIVRPRQQGLQEEGDFDRGRLRVIAQPARIDWLFTVREKGDESEGPFDTLGPLALAVQVFQPPIDRWLREFAPEIKRLGFGAILLAEVPSRADGYGTLQRFLPSVRLEEDSSDFIYQINRKRPTTTGIDGLEINRLSKWSVMLRTDMVLSFQGIAATQMPGPVHHALRLELDINTAAEFVGPLPHDRLGDIFSELQEMAEEIAARGDVK